jgi:ankyrin repeat protein
MDELCAQHCDTDIRNALGCLPKTLTETFSRALLRIVSRRNTSIVVKTFSWVAIAKRPLTLDELREAISIEIGQPQSMPERLVNGVDQLASWCENLIHVDEELRTVQFAHQAIHKFIIEGPTGPRLENFCFNLPDADHHAGEICVTYLHFNDFKTTLARRPQPMKPVDPIAMARLALSHQRKVPNAIPSFGWSSRRPKSTAQVDVVGVLSTYEREDGEESMRKLQQGHPFLHYASVHWISHTSRFRRDSKTWNLWHRMIMSGHDLTKKPWPEQQEFNALDPEVLAWGLQSRHYALIRLLDGCGAISAAQREDKLISAVQGDLELLDVLLEGDCSPKTAAAPLRAASEDGHLEVVERLLAAGADVNAGFPLDSGQTALQAASKCGRLEVVERLLAAGADVNADPWLGRTALFVASEGGHLEIVERLLAAGADVNAAPTRLGQTALQVASGGGHLEIVERLLAAGADSNAIVEGGRTALEVASEAGHLDVIERLVMAGADVNVSSKRGRSRTALQAASGNGHLELVERLLAAGADVNAAPARLGRTALQAAAGGGHLEVIERLLMAGADVNASSNWDCGRTALQAASEGGHLEAVARLLATGADANFYPAWDRGLTAIQAAAKGGHLDVIERLLTAGADVNAVPSRSGRTALQAASEGGYSEVVERLLAAGADVNADPAPVDGRTALEAAYAGDHYGVVERLLAAGAGANADPPEGGGGTPVQAAQKGGHLAQRVQDELAKPTPETKPF